jgi:hypothetical protein
VDIITTTKAEAVEVATHLIEMGAGFTVQTLEIFQGGPTFTTGDDMWECMRGFLVKNRHMDISIRISK